MWCDRSTTNIVALVTRISVIYPRGYGGAAVSERYAHSSDILLTKPKLMVFVLLKLELNLFVI